MDAFTNDLDELMKHCAANAQNSEKSAAAAACGVTPQTAAAPILHR